MQHKIFSFGKMLIKFFGGSQPPEVLLRKTRCSKIFSKLHRRAPMFESVFNKIAGLKVCNFIKKRLQHRYFPEKFAKF